MANTRTVVAKSVLGGTLTGLNGDNEIWSTSFWTASYGEGGPGDDVNTMGTFDCVSYLNTQVAQFAAAVMVSCPPWVTLTYTKCNQFHLVAGKVKQINDPTVEHLNQSIAGGTTGADGATFVTALGWGLQSSTGSRGKATHGRMFLPPMAGGFTQDTWSKPQVDGASGRLHTAWSALVAQDTAGGLNHLPSLVSVPKAGTGGTTFQVNSADITIAEYNVWVLRSRKNKLHPGGNRTTYPSFA